MRFCTTWKGNNFRKQRSPIKLGSWAQYFSKLIKFFINSRNDMTSYDLLDDTVDLETCWEHNSIFIDRGQEREKVLINL